MEPQTVRTENIAFFPSQILTASEKAAAAANLYKNKERALEASRRFCEKEGALYAKR